MSNDEKVDTTPPVTFANPIFETDMNDSFDEEALLKKIPKPFRQNAISLLKTFDERPNEITWDSSGHIYLDEKVLPNATIFILLPALFRKKLNTKLSGMPDFISKLNSMGLSHLIRSGKNSPIKSPQVLDSKASSSSTSSTNWWFIGE